MSAKPTSGDWTTHGLGIYAGRTLVGHACWAENCDSDIQEQAHAPIDEDECIANAKLMASAPILLESLKLLLEAVRNEDIPTDKEIETAIAIITELEGSAE